jgi:tripartite-type tricarboxylate transporter receptor subunit TctC
MIRQCFRVVAGTVALVLQFLGGTVETQDWPGRLITMVVPYAAGGPVNTVGRLCQRA